MSDIADRITLLLLRSIRSGVKPNKLVLPPLEAAQLCSAVSELPQFHNFSPIGQTICGMLIVEAPLATEMRVEHDANLV